MTHYCEECHNKIQQSDNEFMKEKDIMDMNKFAIALKHLISEYGIEKFSNTTNWILTDYLMNCLEAYHSAFVKNNERQK